MRHRQADANAKPALVAICTSAKPQRLSWRPRSWPPARRNQRTRQQGAGDARFGNEPRSTTGTELRRPPWRRRPCPTRRNQRAGGSRKGVGTARFGDKAPGSAAATALARHGASCERPRASRAVLRRGEARFHGFRVRGFRGFCGRRDSGAGGGRGVSSFHPYGRRRFGGSFAVDNSQARRRGGRVPVFLSVDPLASVDGYGEGFRDRSLARSRERRVDDRERRRIASLGGVGLVRRPGGRGTSASTRTACQQYL